MQVVMSRATDNSTMIILWHPKSAMSVGPEYWNILCLRDLGRLKDKMRALSLVDAYNS